MGGEGYNKPYGVKRPDGSDEGAPLAPMEDLPAGFQQPPMEGTGASAPPAQGRYHQPVLYAAGRAGKLWDDDGPIPERSFAKRAAAAERCLLACEYGSGAADAEIVLIQRL